MTSDEGKNRDQLIAELDSMRARVAELESRDRETEERYRSLVELSPEGILVCRDGVYVFCNMAGARLLGAAKPEQVIGRSVYDFTPPEYREIVADRLHRLHAGSPSVPCMEQTIVSLDGRMVPIEVTGIQVPYGGVPAQLVIIRDISERKRSEEDLRFHSHLLDSVDQAIIALDLEGGILFWNRFAEQLYGWSGEEVLGRNVIDILPANEWGISLFRGGETGTRASGEFLFRHRTGTPFPVMVTNSPVLDERGVLSGMVSISCDISERKRTEQELNRLRSHLAELVEEKTSELQRTNQQLEQEVLHRRHTAEALRASERKLRSILEESRDGVALADEQGTIVEWNSTTAKMTGVPKAQALGKAIWEVMEIMDPGKFRSQSELRGKIEDSLREMFRTGHSPLFNMSMSRPGMEMRIIQHLAFPIPTENGFMVGCISRDITAQKRTERTLSRSRAHLALAERLAHLGSFQFEVYGEEVVWSEESFRITGHNPQMGPPAKGKYFSMVHPDDRNMLRRAILRTVAKGEPFDCEYRILLDDGSMKYMRSVGRAIPDAEGTVRRIFGTMQDISRHKRVELDRRRTIEILRLFHQESSIRDLMREVVVRLKEWTGCEAVGIRLKEGEDYPFYEARGFSDEFKRTESSLCMIDAEGEVVRDETGNPILECMCGYIIRGRLKQPKPFFTRHGSFWTNSTSELLASPNTGLPCRTRNRCITGKYESLALVPLRHSGETIGLFQFNDPGKGRFTPEMIRFLETVGDNVAIALAARHMEKQLLEQKNFYETILETTAGGVWVTDRNDVMRFANRSVEEISGVPREQILGCNVLRDFPEETLRFFRPLYLKARESLQPLFFDPVPVVTPSGRPTYQSGWLVPRVVDGRFDGMISTLYDVTEQLKLEEEIQKSRKLESIGVLAGGIAHNFNNIHTAVLGNIALAKMDTTNDSEQYSALLDAEEAISRAQDLTRRLITFSRGGKPMRERTSLGPLLMDEAQLALRDSNIHCRYSIPDSLPPVKIDRQQIRQVISGIVSNARDAMCDQNEMEISAEDILTHESDSLPVRPGRYIRITVKDSGPGIPPEFIARLFDPFFTTKPGHDGLGLTTSFSIIKNHEGYLTAESGIRTGAAFSIYLPVQENSTDPNGSLSNPPPPGE